ncbi:DUF559 domain-containing protein [Kribbella sp. NBC_00889]|uniref:DUF559 domain-containing protein n=1 Tax=Kribbella sp. NBC_00889 TaxID=2975974 RepID=UPI00386A6FEE|nr:DUF559 domain-containing protein [Kribbella sp. NBC_00889]
MGSVYAPAEVLLTPRVRAAAALPLAPGGVISHHTALGLWCGTGPTSGELHLSVRRDPHRVVPRVRGLRVHEIRNLEGVPALGVPVTPPERTFLDLASYSDLTELVTAGDALVRRTNVDPARLIESATAAVGLRGIRLARRAATLVRPGVDSPMESRLRLLLVLDGLPEPEVGRVVLDSDGGWLAQPDLCYPELKIAIEYDGRHHAQDIGQWRRDIRRRENLEREGWLVRVITAHDLLHAPGTVVARITQDLRARGHRVVDIGGNRGPMRTRFHDSVETSGCDDFEAGGVAGA